MESQPVLPAASSFSYDGLNPEQIAAVRHDGGPLLIVAGAGTGKTRVLTHRIARLIGEGCPASGILAVTFTNKAAAEMKHRVEALVPGRGASVWMHTFHSFAARLLRQHGRLLGINPHFTIFDSDDQKKLISQAMKELGVDTKERSKAGLYVSVISRAKDDLLDARSYSIHAQTGQDVFRQNAALIYEKYQKALDKSGGLDFGDLLLKCCELLKEFEQVRALLQEQFVHVLVDEYQDTNHAQYVLTKALSAKHRNLCVVGDPDQSVYGWRGADIRNIMEFERDFKDAKVVVLEQNYRSTSRILTAATAVIERNKYRKPKSLWTRKEGGDPVSVHEQPNELEEAKWVARRIQGLVAEGGSLRDVAVFYRTNAQSRSFEEAFRHHQIPYKLIGSLRFYERKEVKDALAYARVLLNPSDQVSLGRILNEPGRGIGKTSQEKLEAFAEAQNTTLYEALVQQGRIDGLTSGTRRSVQEFLLVLEKLRDELPRLTPSALMAQILERTRYLAALEESVDTDPEASQRIDNLQELVNALKDYELSNEDATIAGFLEGVTLQSGADTYDAETPTVTLMTIHLAKGLEFPVVYLTGLEEGLFPIGGRNTTADDLEEERRLCYVGMTRARERLFLSYAATRRIFGQTYSNLPSRFILEANLATETTPLVGAIGSPPPRSETQPVAPRGPSSIKAGSRVKHPSFGKGVVLTLSGSGEGLKATVRFDSGISKKLILRYAPLEAL